MRNQFPDVTIKIKEDAKKFLLAVQDILQKDVEISEVRSQAGRFSPTSFIRNAFGTTDKTLYVMLGKLYKNAIKY